MNNLQEGRGGFIPANVRRNTLEDCLMSGDPVNYFATLQDTIKNIQIEIDNTYDEEEFWDQVEDEIWPEKDG